MGFNSKLSGRVLRVEIVADPPESEICQALTDCGVAHKSKRHRGGVGEKENALDTKNFPEEQILYWLPGVEDALIDENHEEKIQLAEDSPSGDEAASSGDNSNSNWSEDGSRVLKVETLYISSPILAAKSAFFYKLFSNGMMESKQRDVTLRINASEEAAVMELLNFMHSSKLRVDTAPDLLDVLMAADKFQVASFMGRCSRVLTSLAFTPESALLYLSLPPTISRDEAVQPLMDASRQFLAAHYKDFSMHKDEVMKLPLVGIEAVLSSDDLQVSSEDEVYDIALKWTEIHYPNSEERRDILCTRLGRLIRFPYMTPTKLRNLLTCDYFNKDFTTKVLLDVLFFKAYIPHRRRTRAVEGPPCVGHRFMERAYKFLPVKVVEFALPLQQCVVYLDLKREECAGLFPSGCICSQGFHLGGQSFFLSANCFIHPPTLFNCFGLYLTVEENGSVTFPFEFEFAVRSKPLEKYISPYSGSYVFRGGKDTICLFSFPWSSFMADSSSYFINGVLYARVELTAKREPPV